MTNISKCLGTACEKRDTCYRFTAPTDPMWQAYLEPDRNLEECRSYWLRAKNVENQPKGES